MTSTLDIWNTVIGILGLLSLICQLLFWIITSRLPSAKLRVLENSLKETESLLSRCIEEGRINSAAEAAQFDCRLAELRTRTSDISLETLSAKTYLDDLRNMMQGLSQRTDDVREEVLAARVDITVSELIAAEHAPLIMDSGK
ncbi:hypothetical protein C8Q78DRAFT_1040073 [Trametes maxima]|nr:hypothetical protein C8Q78DRAFT_1040073 [Trametes maxima]